MGVLDGVRVIDLSQGAAGPICAMTLGDHGAEVVKVEPCDGEWGRALGPPFVGEVAASYIGMNRNKRSLAIDLKRPQGVEVVRRLVQRSDVLVESFRPGVVERLGLGYEELIAANPRLVYCSINAFGPSGPWRDKPGVDGVVQAMSGLMSVTGLDGAEPVKVGVPAADVTAAAHAVQGLLLGLLARVQTGRGQRVSVSLLDAMLAFQTVPLTMYLASGEPPKRLGSAAAYSAPNEAYRTMDGAIMVAAYTPARWAGLCQILERPDLLEDARFRANADRVANRSELRVELERTLRRRATDEWIALLEAADILCAPLYDYPSLLAQPQVMENDMLVRVPHPVLGETATVGIPVKLTELPGSVRAGAPLVGEHSATILSEAGYGVEEIHQLIATGTVAARDVGAVEEEVQAGAVGS
ncbi:MAG: CoA transferase [Chloroflexota bacterium]|nr:CoA transferase [Chloroflexota bacterium]